MLKLWSCALVWAVLRTKWFTHAHEFLPLEPNCTRTTKPVIILHVPKSGGTTICSALKSENRCIVQSNARSNCWVRSDGPEWCCFPHSKLREKTCQERRSYPNGYTMIERYMDTDPATNRTLFCSGIEYGIVIRAAVSRATSHVHHFLVKGPKNTNYRSDIRGMFLRRTPTFVQSFFDRLDATTANTKESMQLINNTFGRHSDDLELACYKVNAFSSNYLIRMLLGRQLGDPPLLASSATITPEKVEAAKWALSQFDFILHTEQLVDDSLAELEQDIFQFSISKSDNVANHTDKIYTTLNSPGYRRWFEKRNKWDAVLVENAPNFARARSK